MNDFTHATTCERDPRVTRRRTNFTRQMWLIAVETASSELSDALDTRAIYKWAREQRRSSIDRMRLRVVETGLHVLRKYHVHVVPAHGRDAPRFLEYAAHFVWAHRGCPVPDQESFAELRRILEKPTGYLYCRAHSPEWTKRDDQ